MAHQLAGLAARGRERETGHDVVQAHQQAQEVLTGDPGLAASLLVVGAELPFQDLVVAAHLLLLAQLQQVLALADTPAAVLAGGTGGPSRRTWACSTANP